MAGGADYAVRFRVTPGFLRVLGATRRARPAAHGEEEAEPGGPLAVVITDAFWKRQFNGDARARRLDDQVRRSRLHDRRACSSRRVRFPGARRHLRAGRIVPDRRPRARRTTTGSIARLRRRGARWRSAAVRDAAIAQRLEAAVSAAATPDKSTDVVPLQDLVVGRHAQTLFIAARRRRPRPAHRVRERREPAARARHGPRARNGRARGGRRRPRPPGAPAAHRKRRAGAASPRRAARGSRGSACSALMALAPANLPRLDEIHVDVPALASRSPSRSSRASSSDSRRRCRRRASSWSDGLRQGGKGSSIGARGGWARNAFVIAEIALAVVLVVGAGLLGAQPGRACQRSIWASRRNVSSCSHGRPGARSRRGAARDGVLSRSLAGVCDALPGVTADRRP